MSKAGEDYAPGALGIRTRCFHLSRLGKQSPLDRRTISCPTHSISPPLKESFACMLKRSAKPLPPSGAPMTELDKTFPPLHRIFPQSGYKFVKGSAGRCATGDVIGKWCFNSYTYVLISNSYITVVAHGVVFCISYDGPRNPMNATEQRTIGKLTGPYFDTSVPITFSSKVSNFHG